MHHRRRARRARIKARTDRPDFRPFVFLLVLTGWIAMWTFDAALSANLESENRLPGPLDAIGKVNTDGGRFCTGVLVGQRQVLTAAHCLWNADEGRWRPARTVRFVAGFDQNNPRGQAAGLSYVISPQYDPTRPNTPEALAEDWALLTLDDGLAGAVAPLPVMTLDRARFIQLWGTKAKFHLAGFRQGREHRLTRQMNCRLLGLDGTTGALLHDCLTPKGASGSPVLAYVDGTYQVVGLHVASATLAQRRVSVAAPVRPATQTVASLH